MVGITHLSSECLVSTLPLKNSYLVCHNGVLPKDLEFLHFSNLSPQSSFCLNNFLSSSTPRKSAKRNRLARWAEKKRTRMRWKTKRGNPRPYCFAHFFRRRFMRFSRRTKNVLYIYIFVLAGEGPHRLTADGADRKPIQRLPSL